MKPTIRIGMLAGASVVLLASAPAVSAQDIPPPSGEKIQYSPYPKKNFPNRVYFGDTHLHTSYSTDAGMIGNTLWSGGGLSICARRRGQVQQRPAREVAATARLSRCIRPLGEPRPGSSARQF